MRGVAFTGLLLGAVFCATAGAGEGSRLLLSFEKDECWKLAGSKQEKDGKLVIRYNSYGTFHYMNKGDVTHGEWALARSYKGAFDPFGKGVTESGLAAVQRTGRLLNGFGWMAAKKLTGDWSGFDRLRIDVKSTEAAARISVRVADRRSVPVPERRYALKPGKWLTLEFDLAAASDPKRLDRTKLAKGHELFFRCRGSALYPARVLDRKAVFAVFVNLIKCEGATTILLDNLRLVPAGAAAKSKHPLVTDKGPWPKPEALPAETKPEKPAGLKLPPPGGKLKPGKPVTVDLSKVRATGYGRMHNDRCGIAVVDSMRMAINVALGANRTVLITNDGGLSWRGLGQPASPAGKAAVEKAELLFKGNLMMVGACSTPGDDGGDLLLVTLKHCSGGEEPSWVWFKRVAFDGKTGWKAGPSRVVDVDSWHCPEHTMDVLRLPSGRIWAAWSAQSRAGGGAARYSDDGGKTWRALAGKLGRGRHGGKRPLFLPYDKGVACFFKEGWREFFTWARTDGKKWSAPEQPIPKLRSGPISGAAVGDAELFVVVGFRKTRKLLHLAAGKWTEDKSVPFAPWRLSAAGKKLIAVALKDGKVVMAVRAADGKWSAVRELAAAEKGTVDLAVPRVAPQGFLPIVWSTKAGRSIHFLRIRLGQ